MKKMRYLALLLALALVLAGCGAKTEMERPAEAPGYGFADMAMGGDNGVVVESATETSQSAAGSAGAQNQKLIRTMDMEVETNDLDALMSSLNAKISQLGGYVENKSVRNGSITSTKRYRYADLTIRIPVDRLDEFAQHVEGQTNVTYINESAKDITLTYVATESRITALETEQTRLLELLANAQDMSDLLLIEQRLTDVRTELEEYTSQLRLYDNLVDYGTLQLNISEVQEFTPVEEETLWQKISGGLADNWENLGNGAESVFVFLVTSLPYLIPLAGAGAITLIAVKLANRKVKPAAKKEPEKSKEDK